MDLVVSATILVVLTIHCQSVGPVSLSLGTIPLDIILATSLCPNRYLNGLNLRCKDWVGNEDIKGSFLTVDIGKRKLGR